MKFDKKTLIYAGVGVAVLVIGYFAYKKFGKKKEGDDQLKTSSVEEGTTNVSTPTANAPAPTKITPEQRAQIEAQNEAKRKEGIARMEDRKGLSIGRLMRRRAGK